MLKHKELIFVVFFAFKVKLLASQCCPIPLLKTQSRNNRAVLQKQVNSVPEKFRANLISLNGRHIASLRLL